MANNRAARVRTYRTYVCAYTHGNEDAVFDRTPDVRGLTRYNNVAYPDQLDTGASVNTHTAAAAAAAQTRAKFKYRAAEL